MPNNLQLGTGAPSRAPGKTRVFSVTELQRSTSGVYLPTKVRFEWDHNTMSSPRGDWKQGLKQRTNRVDYPGADEPSESVLGPNWKPLVLEGVWDDRYAGRDFAWNTHLAFKELAARGNLVRVEFEDLGVTGIITDYDPGVRRRNFITWSFTLSPHYEQLGGIARTQKPQIPIALASPEKLVEDVSNIVAQAASSQDDLPPELPTTSETADMIAGVVDSVNDWANKVQEYKDIVDTQLFGPIQQVETSMLRLAQTMQSIRGSAQDVLGTVAELHADANLAYQTAIDALDFEVWQRDMAYQARLLVLASDDAQQELNQRVQPNVLAIHRPHADENVYSVSNQYYGTPSNWRAIVSANGLTYLQFKGDEVLVIPEVR
jgi:hypothetical protein